MAQQSRGLETCETHALTLYLGYVIMYHEYSQTHVYSLNFIIPATYVRTAGQLAFRDALAPRVYQFQFDTNKNPSYRTANHAYRRWHAVSSPHAMCTSSYVVQSSSIFFFKILERPTCLKTSSPLFHDFEKGLKSQLELWALPSGPGVRADYYRNGPKAPSQVSIAHLFLQSNIHICFLLLQHQ